MLWGYFQKIVIADHISKIADTIFNGFPEYTGVYVIIGAVLFAFQIYCDFSAYSDMAIGLAALLGYRFPRNFDQPYRSASLQEFWRRWHISLSTWLRDYLYIGLGGNRGGLPFLCRNLLITMVLGGLWHGAKWTFLIWGALHGLVLAAERIWRQYKPASWPSVPRIIAILFTFHIVVIGWIFFRAETFDGAIAYLEGIFAGRPGMAMMTPLAVGLILLGLEMHFFPPQMMPSIAIRLRRVSPVLMGLLIGLSILIVDAMRYEGVAPFIYYQF